MHLNTRVLQRIQWEKQHPVNGTFVKENALLARDINGDWENWFKLTHTVTHKITFHNSG